nr:3-methyl-2-oxobutanoate hydroxymethyltransferase [uncultured Cellulosilyticum sp.]
MKQTVVSFKKAKQNHEKITMLTAYDYISAKLMDQAGIHALLVGDSVGMVFCGLENTLSVTVDQIIYHTQAVQRGAKEALIVTDMPFMSYQADIKEALCNAGRLVKEGGAEAVKLEGGKEICPQIQAITKAGIPVMGHIGLTPQSVHAFGGFKVQGKEVEAAKALIEDAKAVEAAGAFAIVLECIPYELALRITESINIPTIGIGAGNGCDGQILVYQDLLGMYEGIAPKFVKHYANIGEQMRGAFSKYKEEVQGGIFPNEIESFHMSKENLKVFNEEV